MRKNKYYKYSIFNSIIPLDNGYTIVYNSLSNAIISSESLPVDISSISDKKIENLLSLNFIVPETQNEASEVFNKVNENLIDSDTFYLMINPTLECNCRCWYCIEDHPKSEMSKKTILHLQETINKILPSYNHLTLSFFGGEPFLKYKQIVEPIMTWAQQVCGLMKKNISFMFTTNGLLLNSDIIDSLKKFPNQHYQITIDGGREYHNSTRIYNRNNNCDSFNKIIDTIYQLTQNHIKVLIRLNLTHENICSTDEIIDCIRDWPEDQKKYLEVSCQQVWQDCKKGSLFNKFIEIREKFKKSGITPANKDFDWINTCCYGDRLHSAVINYNGNIHKCSAIDFTVEPPIGNINNTSFIECLKDDFNRYWKLKCSNNQCFNCRVLPLCMKGCYKHVIKNPMEYCMYPKDTDKDELIKQNLEELSFRIIS